MNSEKFFTFVVVVVFLLFLQWNICTIGSKTHPGIRWNVWTKMFIKSASPTFGRILQDNNCLAEKHMLHWMVNMDKDVVNLSDTPKVES